MAAMAAADPLFKYDNDHPEALYNHGYQSVLGPCCNGVSLLTKVISICSRRSGQLGPSLRWLAVVVRTSLQLLLPVASQRGVRRRFREYREASDRSVANTVVDSMQPSTCLRVDTVATTAHGCRSLAQMRRK